MSGSNYVNSVNLNSNEPTIIKTDGNQIIGQDKCPKCGSTDISHNINTGTLHCNYCRYKFENKKIEGFDDDLCSLNGTTIGSGMCNIEEEIDNSITLKCTSCGAEVVIDTSSSTQARCHWCRNILSINEQIPNGAVPDVILPFKITKDIANKEINVFVSKRNFFANKKFKEEFKLDNVMGVYFPYAIVDLNAAADFYGKGEHEVRCYTVGSKEHRQTYYDADLYSISRKFDIIVKNLTVETNKVRLNKIDKTQTNNIINSIMPFDTENSIKFNSNYMKGCTSEKRDSNIKDLEPLVKSQALDIARHACNPSLKYYDRGVAWEKQNLNIKGTQWKTAYLPVWVYSYQELKGNKKFLHYVVVNGRTKEVMGSIPIDMPKLILMSILVEFFGFIAMLHTDFDLNFIFLFSGFVYYMLIYSRYRNSNARHSHETETKNSISNLVSSDSLIRRRTGLSSSTMDGANNKYVTNQTIESKLINSVVGEASKKGK